MRRSNLSEAVEAGLRGDKGGSTPRKAVEAPDSLKSIATARIIDLVSEGEIEGFVHGNDSAQFLRDVYFNETPVQNADGTKNFKSIQVEARLGTQTQDHIPGFPSVENEIGIGVALTAATPWTRSFTNLSLSAVRLRLQVNGLSKTDTTTGDIKGHTVAYAVDLAVDGGAFVQVLNSAFTGKASSTYERSHRVELPPATSSGWIMRVRRLTADDVSVYIQDDTAVASVTEIVDGKFGYPLSAVIGTQLDAGQFQAIPTRSFHLRGRRIKVPVNYDPVTAVYTGVWDGTFKIAYSNNPAWVFYDLATNPRYGLGHMVQELQIDKWSLYAIGQYCDAIVPNGFGGTERRMTCNLYLQKQGDAFKVLTDLASVFRGICYWAGGSIVAVADRPTDPVYTYTNANVVNGQFKYESSSRRARHTAVLVSWNDMTDFGRLKTDYYDNPAGIERYGFQQTEVHAMGCTSRGQAQRLANWILYSEELLTNTCSWSVGIDGTYAVPGQIVRVADKWRAGRRNGGRVSSATTTVVTLDAWPAVNPAIGDSFTIILPTGVSQTRLIGAFNAGLKTITVGTAFTSAPLAQSVWAIDSNDVNTQLFRVLQVLEDDSNSGMYHLVGLQHNPTLFDAVDLGTPINVPSISVVAASNIPRPTNVVVSSVERAGTVISVPLLTARWDAMGGASNYRVQWQKDNGEWGSIQTVDGTTADYDSPFPGVYRAQVSSVNALGIVSPPALSAAFTLADPVRRPNAVAELEGGRGPNLLSDIYSTYESTTLPAFETNRITATRVTGYVTSGLRQTVTGSGTTPYLTFNPNGNMSRSSTVKRAIVSFWARSSHGNNYQVGLRDPTTLTAVNSASTVIATGAWVRYSFALDLAALPGDRMHAIFTHVNGGATSYLEVDGVMVEEARGISINASTYVRGHVASLAVSAFAIAATALDTADGKIDSFYQSTAPAHPPAALGDFWIHTGDGNKLHRSNGSSWVLAQDNGIGTAITNAATAQGTADGKVRTWFANYASPPTASAVGDLWYVIDRGMLNRWNGSSWALVADNSADVKSSVYLANSDFRQGMAGWSGDVNDVDNSNQDFFTQTTNGLVQSERHLTKAPNAVTSQTCNNVRVFSAQAGEGYSINLMAARYSGNGAFYVGIVFVTETGAYAWHQDLPIDIPNDGTWNRVTKVIVPPSNITSIKQAYFRFITDNHTAGYYYADDVTITKLTSKAMENLLGIGKNLYPNASFGGENGEYYPLQVTYNPAGGTWDIRNRGYGIAAGASWTIPGEVGMLSVYRGASLGTSVADFGDPTPSVSVVPGARYEWSVLMATHRCTVDLAVGWYTAAGAYITETGTGQMGGGGIGGDNEAAFGDRKGAFFVAPAGAMRARFWFRRLDTLPGQADSYSWFYKPFFGRAGDNQTMFSEWSDSTTKTAGAMSADGTHSVVNVVDVYQTAPGYKRLGLRVANSGHRIGNQRNLNQAVAQNIASTGKITANSSGQVSIVAHDALYGGFSVAYSAVTNAVTGLTVGSTYVIYCVDDDFSGGTRTWYAGANPATVAALGDGIYQAGYITIPSSGTGSGGAGGGGSGGTGGNDWCVAADSYMVDGTLAVDQLPNMMLACYNEDPVNPNIRHLRIQKNDSAMADCIRLLTRTGARIVASKSTPMTLRNGVCIPITQMLGHDALVYRRDGSFTWDPVVEIQEVGERLVSKIVVHQQCYFAGEDNDAFIATHNPINVKP